MEQGAVGCRAQQVGWNAGKVQRGAGRSRLQQVHKGAQQEQITQLYESYIATLEQ